MTFESINKVLIKWQKDIDDAVLGEIKEKAVEHGISTEYLLNEKAIISALEKQIPKKLRVDDEGWLCCPKCDETFKLHNQYHEKNRYCGNCGQKIDWSEVNAKKKE